MIKEITYTRRVNLGNYEHEETSVVYALGENENPAIVLSDLKGFVMGGDAPAKTNTAPTVSVAPPTEVKPETTPGPQQSTVYMGKEEEFVAEPSETKPQTSESVEAPAVSKDEAPKKRGRKKKEVEDDNSETVVETPVLTGSKTATKEIKEKLAKAAAKGVTKYDRAHDTHKKIVTEMLDSSIPKWRETVAKKVKEASVAMVDEDFLDTTGELLQGFKAKFLSMVQ